MYDGHIGQTKFNEIRNLISDYIDWGEESVGFNLEEIEDRAYQYYEEGRLSASQYDYLLSLIDDME